MNMDAEDLAEEFFTETCATCGGGFLEYARSIAAPAFVLTPDQWQRASLQGVDPLAVEERCTTLLRAALQGK
jgi:hypothetical protein